MACLEIDRELASFFTMLTLLLLLLLGTKTHTTTKYQPHPPVLPGTHVALLSIFGLILGIGIGICVKPCVDRINNKSKSSNARAVSGDRGLESWASSAGNRSVSASVMLWRDA